MDKAKALVALAKLEATASRVAHDAMQARVALAVADTWYDFVKCGHSGGDKCDRCGAKLGICHSCGRFDWLLEQTGCCEECEQAKHGWALLSSVGEPSDE